MLSKGEDWGRDWYEQVLALQYLLTISKDSLWQSLRGLLAPYWEELFANSVSQSIYF